ncbi:hypothetical protein C0991_009268, partial [Blastosporella zonata]
TCSKKVTTPQHSRTLSPVQTLPTRTNNLSIDPSLEINTPEQLLPGDYPFQLNRKIAAAKNLPVDNINPAFRAGSPRLSASLLDVQQPEIHSPKIPAPEFPIPETSSLEIPTPLIPPMAQPHYNSMPARGHGTAPLFNPSKPRELPRYFTELKFLFASCTITENAKKKALGIRYVDYNTLEQWLSVSEYQPYDDSQPALPYSYDNWKRAVISLYPGADATTKYSMADLDQIIGEADRQAQPSLDHSAQVIHYNQKLTTITEITLVRQPPIHFWAILDQTRSSALASED